MADKPRFDDDAMKVIQIEPCSGEAIIAISRAILSSTYSDAEFNKDFFTIFIAIDDQYDHIILDGYGRFNSPSARFMLSNYRFINLIKAASGSSKIDTQSNAIIYQDEIREIVTIYGKSFEASLVEFKDYFDLVF
jgi:hypothetical protein